MRNSGILKAITLNIILLNFKLEGISLQKYKIRKKNLVLTHLEKQLANKMTFFLSLQGEGVVQYVKLVFKNVL